MNKRAFDAALRAALKITFSTTLLACSGAVDIEESNPPEVEPKDPGNTSSSAAASSGSGGDGGGGIALPTPTARPEPRDPEPRPREVCEGELTPPVDWWTFDQHTFACCSQSLDAAIPEGDLSAWIEANFENVDTLNCCTQVVAPNQQALWSGNPLPHPPADGVVEACCSLQTGTPTCMAWGPPTPPAMDAADWDAWLALEGDASLTDLGRAA